MESVDDVHSRRDGVEDDVSFARRQQTAGRRHPEDEVVRHPPEPIDRVRQVGMDGNAVGGVVEDVAGVAPGQAAVDHADQLVPVGTTHQAVGRLSVEQPEVALAVHHRGRSDRSEYAGRGVDTNVGTWAHMTERLGDW